MSELSKQRALELLARAAILERDDRTLANTFVGPDEIPEELRPWVDRSTASTAALPAFVPRRVLAAWALDRLHEVERPPHRVRTGHRRLAGSTWYFCTCTTCGWHGQEYPSQGLAEQQADEHTADPVEHV